MAFRQGALTDEQRKRIEANRQKALQRVRQRNGESAPSHFPPEQNSRPVPTTQMNQIRNGFEIPAEFQRNTPNEPSPKRPRIELTPEQRARIEANRQKALEIRKNLARNNRDATDTTRVAGGDAGGASAVNNTDAGGGAGSRSAAKSRYEPPSIRRQDYIEFDFATMKDSRGGFLNTEETSAPPTADSTSLEEWKEKQKKLMLVKELPPPLDIDNAPKCFECGSLELDPNLYTNFRHVRACRKCVKSKPEKYALLTKTECKEDYLLTDPELKDTELLPRIEKPNPHGYSRMQLFLRFQVEEYAWKKWGSAEGLDQEWERRESMRIKRRDKKYNEQLREMRKKTRAEEYTRKLRNGDNLGDRHVHDWSAPLSIPDQENMVKKRCIDCGVEIEEYVFQ